MIAGRPVLWGRAPKEEESGIPSALRWHCWDQASKQRVWGQSSLTGTAPHSHSSHSVRPARLCVLGKERQEEGPLLCNNSRYTKQQKGSVVQGQPGLLQTFHFVSYRKELKQAFRCVCLCMDVCLCMCICVADSLSASLLEACSLKLCCPKKEIASPFDSHTLLIL